MTLGVTVPLNMKFTSMMMNLSKNVLGAYLCLYKKRFMYHLETCWRLVLSDLASLPGVMQWYWFERKMDPFDSAFILDVSTCRQRKIHTLFPGYWRAWPELHTSPPWISRVSSRTLTPSKQNYHSSKLEFLALKWSVTEHFKEYLAYASFTVCTDNNPLTYMLTTPNLDAMGHCWVRALTSYEFTLEYQKGSDNAATDMLSQVPVRYDKDTV